MYPLPPLFFFFGWGMRRRERKHFGNTLRHCNRVQVQLLILFTHPSPPTKFLNQDVGTQGCNDLSWVTTTWIDPFQNSESNSAAVIAAKFLLAQIGLCWADCTWASFLSTWPHLLRLVHRITAALHQILNQNRFHAILRSIILMNNMSFLCDNWQCVFFFGGGEAG